MRGQLEREGQAALGFVASFSASSIRAASTSAALSMTRCRISSNMRSASVVCSSSSTSGDTAGDGVVSEAELTLDKDGSGTLMPGELAPHDPAQFAKVVAAASRGRGRGRAQGRDLG